MRVVQELLGHASVTTTQVYTLVTVDSLREVYAAAHPRALELTGRRPRVPAIAVHRFVHRLAEVVHPRRGATHIVSPDLDDGRDGFAFGL